MTRLTASWQIPYNNTITHLINYLQQELAYRLSYLHRLNQFLYVIFQVLDVLNAYHGLMKTLHVQQPRWEP